MGKEVWKDIKNYEGYYQVSNLGNVRSLDRHITHKNGTVKKYYGRILKAAISRGYYKVDLVKKGKRKNATIHRLVAESFIPNCEHLPQINHINGDKLDNRAVNLEWCSTSYNIQHSHDNNLTNTPKGKFHYNSKLKEKDIINIRKLLTQGLSQFKIADKYGVSRSCIQSIKEGKTWKHLK